MVAATGGTALNDVVEGQSVSAARGTVQAG